MLRHLFGDENQLEGYENQLEEMPVLVTTCLKDTLKNFLRDNDITFDEGDSKEELAAIVRETLTTAGINPDLFDFTTRRELTYVNVKLEDRPSTSSTSLRDLEGLDSFELSPAHDAPIRWKRWLKRFEIYSTAVSLRKESAEVQRSVFLHKVGSKISELVENLTEDATIVNPLERTQKAITAYFEPRRNRHFERNQFRKLSQNSEETTDAFVARLRSAAGNCQYTDSDDRILEQLIEKCYNSSMRRKLLEKGDGLDLDTALDIARNFESLNAQCNVMEKGAVLVPEVAQLNSCGYCNGTHPPRRCPAYGKTCMKCFGKNHFTNACRRKSGPAASSRSQNSYAAPRNSSSAPATKGGHKKKRKKVNHVAVKDEDESDEPHFLSNIQGKSCWFTNLEIGGKPTRLMIDSGASLNILNAADLPRGSTLSKNRSKVTLFDGSDLPCLGTTKLRVFNPRVGESHVVTFTVVENGLSLLGLPTICTLKLVTPSDHVFMMKRRVDHLSWDLLLKKHEKIFDDELGLIKGVKAQMRLRDHDPVFCRARPVPYAIRDRVEKALDDFVRLGTISRVETSDYASPTVNVEKPNGDIRVCADFSVTINKFLEVDEYPLPIIEDIYAQMSGSKVFTRLDARKFYEQIEVDDNSKKYLVINTIKGLYTYNRVPYGIANAPSIAQKCIEYVLKDFISKNSKSSNKCFCYIDDIILSSQSELDLYEFTDAVLKKLSDHGLKLNRSKCDFNVQTTKFLGSILSEKGIECDKSKTECLQKALPPRSKTELRSFLGLARHFSRFVKNMSEICLPLNKLLSAENVEYEWNDECMNAFCKIKKVLCEPPILAYYDPKKQLVLQADAAPGSVGSVLSQIDEAGVRRPIAFAHRTLTKTETRYSHLDKECLALVAAVKKFHKYLYGRSFILETDHKPLLRIVGEKSGLPSLVGSRLSRYAYFLSQYRYSLRFKPGKDLEADGISRLIMAQQESPEHQHDEAHVFYASQLDTLQPITSDLLREFAGKDSVYSAALKWTREGWKSENLPPELMKFYRKRETLSIHDELLFEGRKVVIPSGLISRVLEELHKMHPGMTRMKMLARMYCWWPNIDDSIEQQVSSCERCQEERIVVPKGEVLRWPDAGLPWKRVHLDFAPRFKNAALLIAVCSYSKWLEIGIFRPDQISSEKTISMLKTWFARWGYPNEICSDNGTQFTSSAFRSFCASVGIKQKFSAPGYPATNGEAERFVQFTKNSLRKIMGEDRSNLENNVRDFLFRYRSTPSSVTRRSPALLFLGRELRTELTCMLPVEKEKDCLDFPEADLHEGMSAQFKSFSVRGPKWISGEIVAVEGPRHVRIKDEFGQIHRRHRAQGFRKEKEIQTEFSAGRDKFRIEKRIIFFFGYHDFIVFFSFSLCLLFFFGMNERCEYANESLACPC